MIERPKSGYIKPFDGIRALAIIMILVFHYRPAGFGWLNGGFVGVDVFFVLSGYLITMLLLGERTKTGTVNLKNFWLMRARRLLPAVFTLIIALTLLAIVLPESKTQLEKTSIGVCAKYLPDMTGEAVTIRNQIVPAIAYYINWSFIYSGKSYFELMDRPALFGHLWSLAIEEQFYLFWPVLLLILFRLFGSRDNLLAVVILALAGLSASALYATGQATPLDARAYFGTDTRAYALMLGALLAIFFKPNLVREKISVIESGCVDSFGVFGLAVLGYLCWNLTGGELFIFRGGLFLASLATAIVIISSLNPNSILIKSILSNRIFGWIGKRSYGLYLWHWPVFVLTESHYNYPVDGRSLLILRTALLIGLVEFSYRFIENPIRYGAIGNSWQKLKTAGGMERMKLAGQFVGMGAVMIAVLSFCFVSLAQVKDETISVAKLEPTMIAPVVEKFTPVQDPIEPPLEVEVVQTAKLITLDPPLEAEKSQDPVVLPKVSVVEKPKTIEKAVLALGDSVMLGSASDLKKEIAGVKVDAVVGRQFTDLERIVASQKQSGKIPSLVFIHTGNNGTVEEPLFIQMMELLKDCERVVIFTVRVPRSWQNSNNEIFARVVPRYSNAVLVDWQKESSGRVEYFAKDGIHLRPPQGTSYYAALVKQAFLKDT